MTLRWRLALALAVLSGLATTTTAVIAYTTTSRRLSTEVDNFLAERASRSAPAGRASIEQALAENGPPWTPGRRTGPPGAARPGPLTAQDDVVVQVLLPDRTFVSGAASPSLPISDAEWAVARDGGRPISRTVTVDDVSYRMRTVAWPGAGGGAVQLARDISETERVLTALRWQFFVVGLGVVASAAIAGWFVARRTAAPLQQLTVAAEAVAATGRLDAPASSVITGETIDPRAGARDRDETGRLAQAFTTMLTALQRSRDQQHQLVQDASHELRTPLTSLRTNIEVLERHEQLPPDARAAVFADLRSELGELSSLVTELVQLAGDERDDEPETNVSIDAVVAAAAERAGRRHGRVVTVSGNGAYVRGQRAALERAVGNLLDNAAKFSPGGTPIEVEVHWGRVAVRDHGPGIAPDDVGRVFDRFYRSTAARARPGSGLGLAIVRQVAEHHGGRPFATNHPDGGAVVGMELPVSCDNGTDETQANDNSRGWG